MNRIVVGILLSLMTLTSYAQDLITTKKGEDIKAKILEVSSTEVKYKRYSNLEGPTFTISTRDILMVRYQNGEKEIFAESNSNKSRGSKSVHAGMRYNEYKDLYNTNYYIHEAGDAYSPFWSGLASFVIPGLGQGICGEWGRGLCIMATNVGLSVLFYGSLAAWNAAYNQETQEGGEGASLLVFASVIGQVCLDIWNVFDAVKVAKVKNMYQQDIRAQRASFDIRIDPFIAYNPSITTSNNQPTAGLSLKVLF
jgi:hypothetical protein